MNDRERESLERVTAHLRDFAEAERKLVADIESRLPGLRDSVTRALWSHRRRGY